MTQLKLDIDGTVLEADVYEEDAPKSVAALREILPINSKLSHVRWSGFATWVNLKDSDLPEIPRENHTVYPSRGDLLLYPGFKNDKELLFACGPTCFKSPAGEQAGNHVATVTASNETLEEIEQTTLTDGELDIEITLVE